jgi:uncharacterized membrane protein YkvA (DUF1232 family)
MSRRDWIVLGVIVAVVAVVTLVIAVRLIFRLVAVRRALAAVGAKGQLVFWGALVYTLFPIDILPDPIYLDDITVLGGALWFLTRLLRKQETLAGAPEHVRRLAQVGSRQRARRAERTGP